MKKTNYYYLPTPAESIMSIFLNDLFVIMPENIIGIYLTGSLCLNDFYPNKSDIDFLILCKAVPNKEMAAKLKNIHKRIARKYPKPDLSGVYISSKDILSENIESTEVLTWHENSMRFGKFEMAPVTLAELKNNAITVFGQEPSELPIKIDYRQLNEFMFRNINSYWTNWLNQHSSFFGKKILLFLFPRFTEWSILGVARQLCTLQSGKIVSKKEAGIFCLRNLPSKFHPVISAAIKIREDDRTYPFVRTYAIRPSISRLRQTLTCVSYIINEFNQIYNHSE